MKKILLIAFLLQFFYAHSQTQAPDKRGRKFKLPPGITEKDYLPNRVIVKFKTSTTISNSNRQSKISPITPKVSLKSVNLQKLSSKFPQSARSKSSATILRQQNDGDLSRIYEVRFTGPAKIEDVINELLQDENVEYAEPSYIYHRYYTPNDPDYLNNSQTYLEQVKAPEAWNLIRDASHVIIAIVDSGSDLDHPDLAANIYINTQDPVNGIDDDGDGYIDNYRGWDFIGLSGIQPEEDNDPNVKGDSTDHGVHVSGIASAVSDNGIGVASIANNAKLLIIKTGADNDGSNIYAGPEGIKYAADHHADIINCSWGSPGGSAFVQDVINYALSKGCMVVAAAGNSSSSDPDYPAGYPGVIAVANVRNTDVRNSSSNYGPYVSISAPGTNILNTGYNNDYKIYSGTSMSAPMVSSAAALVKAKFPSLSMQEVGQLLRVTADDIDAKNPAYTGKIGGRLNVFRALTESPPSIRNQKLTIQDKGNGSYPAGDTLELFFDLKDFLTTTNNLTVRLGSNTSYASVLTPQLNVGVINSGETKSMLGPFKVFLAANTPDNTTVEFELSYKDGAYDDSEIFSVTVALDYLNYTENAITTTITSNGRIGYSSSDAMDGAGFIYKDESLLFEASLLIGNSSTKVSNNVRLGTGGSSEHFLKNKRAQRVNSSVAGFAAHSEFDDSNNSNGFHLYIKHNHYAFSKAPDDKYIIAEYKLINNGNTPLNGMYLGLFTDWDIDEGSNNVTEYDDASRLAYTYAKKENSFYAGVKILSTFANPAYYPLSYYLPNDPLENGFFTTAEKFQTLSSGIKVQSIGKNTADGIDVMHVTGIGPFDIPPNDSVKVAFALIAGDNLDDLKNSAAAAQSKYDLLAPEVPQDVAAEVKIKSYPNPVNTAIDQPTLQISLPEDGPISIWIYNTMGQKVKTVLEDTAYSMGRHYIPLNVVNLQDGIYICKLQFKGIEKSTKISLIR